MLIGAYAVAYYAEPRYTKDFNLWIATDAENVDKVWQALEQFGAPLQEITQATLSDPETVYQIGVAPNRVDIISSPTTIPFAEAWNARTESTYEGELLPIVGIDHLIAMKREIGRPRDLADVEALKRVRRV